MRNVPLGLPVLVLVFSMVIALLFLGLTVEATLSVVVLAGSVAVGLTRQLK